MTKQSKKKIEELNRIKEVASEKGETQVTLAKKMGIEPITLASWYQNRRQPHLSDLKKLASVLKVDVCDLIKK